MLSNEITAEIVEGLKNVFAENISQIILYGSTARGDATPESDIDIAVIVDSKLLRQVRERFIEWNTELDLKYDRVFSIIEIEKDKIERWGNVVPFYRNIQKEGIVLWKAA